MKGGNFCKGFKNVEFKKGINIMKKTVQITVLTFIMVIISLFNSNNVNAGSNDLYIRTDLDTPIEAIDYANSTYQ